MIRAKDAHPTTDLKALIWRDWRGDKVGDFHSIRDPFYLYIASCINLALPQLFTEEWADT